MEFIYFLIGVIFGGIIYHFLVGKSSKTNENLQHSLVKTQTENEILQKENTELRQKETLLNEIKTELAQKEIQLQNQKEISENKNQENKNLQQKLEEITLKNQQNLALVNQLHAKNENLENQKKDFLKIQEENKIQFENIANRILDEKTQKFTSLNKENLEKILNPLGENLEKFKQKVDEVYQNEAKERHSLDTTIRLMLEQTSRISQEANNLATALKGQTKVQGDWGEMILERILEDSGLTRGREYFAQQTIKDETGNILKPDFILKLPGNQSVIIDSKVSLVAYERMTSCENEQERKEHLSNHIASMKKHIDTLSQKRYDNLSESLDFTIMFVPIEPAFLTAVQADSQLWNYAYSKQVVLVSPTNLIAFLKLISDLWKRDDQNQNTLKIAEEGAKLYDKLVGFVENLEKVGKHLDAAQKSYDDSFKQLYSGRGNAIKRAETLKKLGLQNKTSKALPQNLIDLAEIDFPNHQNN